MFFTVEEVALYIDEERKIAIPEQIWVSGIPFGLPEKDNYIQFSGSDMDRYLEVFCQQFINLQQVMKELIVTNYVSNSPPTIDDNTQDDVTKKLVERFRNLCQLDQNLDKEIKKLSTSYQISKNPFDLIVANKKIIQRKRC